LLTETNTMTDWVGSDAKKKGSKGKEVKELSREKILLMKCNDLKVELKKRRVNTQKMKKEELQNTLLSQLGYDPVTGDEKKTFNGRGKKRHASEVKNNEKDKIKNRTQHTKKQKADLKAPKEHNKTTRSTGIEPLLQDAEVTAHEDNISDDFQDVKGDEEDTDDYEEKQEEKGKGKRKASIVTEQRASAGTGTKLDVEDASPCDGRTDKNHVWETKGLNWDKVTLIATLAIFFYTLLLFVQDEWEEHLAHLPGCSIYDGHAVELVLEAKHIREKQFDWWHVCTGVYIYAF
jgi:hypothetical protein